MAQLAETTGSGAYHRDNYRLRQRNTQSGIRVAPSATCPRLGNHSHSVTEFSSYCHRAALAAPRCRCPPLPRTVTGTVTVESRVTVTVTVSVRMPVIVNGRGASADRDSDRRLPPVVRAGRATQLP